MKPERIDRIDALDRRAFQIFEKADEPVVIVGGARGAALDQWTPDYLRERFGDVSIRYKVSATDQHPNFHADSLKESFATQAGTFGEFLTAITTGPREARSHALFTGDEQFLIRRRDGVTTEHPELKALLDDVVQPGLFTPEQLHTVWAWFSGPGVRTWLHYDNNGCHNVNLQLVGDKTCHLYAPDMLDELLPFEPGGRNPALNCSAIDFDKPPPVFDDLVVLEAKLRAGDALFIPAWWWHTFRHHGDFNANINYWWKPETERDNPTSRRQAKLEAFGHRST